MQQINVGISQLLAYVMHFCIALYHNCNREH